MLTCLFALELTLKMVGLGLKGYFSNGFNCFDFVIVVVSVAEVLLIGDQDYGLAALRCFRVFRVFKVFKYTPTLSQILGVLISALSSFLSIALLLLLFTAVFSIIGLHVYGDVLAQDERPNFSNIGHSFLTVFQVLTMEDWNVVMMMTVERTDWEAVRTSGPRFIRSVLAWVPRSRLMYANDWQVPYFVLWVIFGNYICLTLFLAIVMEAFEGHYREKEEVTARLIERGLIVRKESFPPFAQIFNSVRTRSLRPYQTLTLITLQTPAFPASDLSLVP